jgi:hypothetical protein
LAGIYPHRERRKKQSASNRAALALRKGICLRLGAPELLVLYIILSHIGSSALFAGGNIVVAAVLLVYMVKNRRFGQAEGRGG